jgi:hypothetical protein
MPPQAAPGSGGGPRRPGPRPAPARGVFVTNAPKEKLPGRPAYVGAAIALLAIVGSLSTLIYLDQLKLETVALTALMVLLFGLLAVVRGHRR